MQVFNIDGHTVNSSFSAEETEAMIRSILAILQATVVPGFEDMSEPEQEATVKSFYEKPIPAPKGELEDTLTPDNPFMFELENGLKVLLTAATGQWFLLLEKEMLSFRPDSN